MIGVCLVQQPARHRASALSRSVDAYDRVSPVAGTGTSTNPRPCHTTQRIDAMYLSAFARLPTTAERETCAEFVKGEEKDAKAWADLGHML